MKAVGDPTLLNQLRKLFINLEFKFKRITYLV